MAAKMEARATHNTTTQRGGHLKTPAILPTAAYYSLTYGQLDGKTRILTNRGETTGPLPPDIIESGRVNEELKTEINKKRKK